jgi:hypothetical protein
MFWTSTIVACVIIVKTHCTKSIWIGSIMTTFAKVQKIVFSDDNIHSFPCMVGKRWETSLCAWAPLFDIMVTMVYWSVSWVAMHSLSHEQCSKWISKPYTLKVHFTLRPNPKKYLTQFNPLMKISWGFNLSLTFTMLC